MSGKNWLMVLVILAILLGAGYCAIKKPSLLVNPDARVANGLTAGAVESYPPVYGLMVNGQMASPSVHWQEISGGDDDRWNHFSGDALRLDAGEITFMVNPAESTDVWGDGQHSLTILALDADEDIRPEVLPVYSGHGVKAAVFQANLPAGRYLVRDAYSENQDMSMTDNYWWLIQLQ